MIFARGLICLLTKYLTFAYKLDEVKTRTAIHSVVLRTESNIILWVYLLYPHRALGLIFISVLDVIKSFESHFYHGECISP